MAFQNHIVYLTLINNFGVVSINNFGVVSSWKFQRKSGNRNCKTILLLIGSLGVNHIIEIAK